jgi:uncharacterized protein YhdP
MELVANCERKPEGWTVDVPELELHTSAKRLDKVDDLVKKFAAERGQGDDF